MKKRRIVALLIAALLTGMAGTVAAQSVGGGVSVWIPESLSLTGVGSVSVETAAGSSVSMGDFLSFPFGVVYNQVYALMPEIDGTVGAAPWFYADTVTGFLMAKLRLPAGPVYLDAFGGLAGFWNATLRPLTKTIERAAAPENRLYSFEAPPAVTGGRFGWGWQAGGGIGVRIDRITVDLNVTYRTVRSDATITGTYSEIDTGAGTVTTGLPYEQPLGIRLAGLSVGIDASFDL